MTTNYLTDASARGGIRPLRRLLAVAAGVSTVGGMCLLGSSPAAAAANAACPDATSSTDSSCTFGYTGGVQHFTVPARVTSLTVSLNGASGGSFTFAGNPFSTGGRGGQVNAVVPAVAGEAMSLVVGGQGGDAGVGNNGPFGPGLGGYGGGGDGGTSGTGANFSGPGAGGGSFLFTGTGTLELAVGGGGGSTTGFGNNPSGLGGSGGGPGTAARDGDDGTNGATGGSAASPNYIGGGGMGGGGAAGGTSGFGAVAGPTVLSLGGTGGSGSAAGGGGGGGYFAGGGGGGSGPGFEQGGGGGGGAGYAASTATVRSSGSGLNSGNGSITISYTPPPPLSRASVSGVSPSSGPVSGGQTVVITGQHFTGATKVVFASTPATRFTVDSDTQITAVSPAHDAGVIKVRVHTTGLSAKTPAARYTYTP